MTENLREVSNIVSAYVSNNSLPHAELPVLISAVNKALLDLHAPAPLEAEPITYVGAVSVKKSIHPDYLISMINGRRYQTLRRHITTSGMTIDEYFSRYSLPSTYPLVCEAYSTRRSTLAMETGLGRNVRPTNKTKVPGAKRGRPRKDAAAVS